MNRLASLSFSLPLPFIISFLLIRFLLYVSFSLCFLCNLCVFRINIYITRVLCEKCTVLLFSGVLSLAIFLKTIRVCVMLNTRYDVIFINQLAVVGSSWIAMIVVQNCNQLFDYKIHISNHWTQKLMDNIFFFLEIIVCWFTLKNLNVQSINVNFQFEKIKKGFEIESFSSSFSQQINNFLTVYKALL